MNAPQSSTFISIAAIEGAFDALIVSIDKLCALYRAAAVDAWALNTPRPDADWLYRVLTDFWYEDGQDGRSTRSYVGLIAASPAMLSAVDDVNTAKNLLHCQISMLKAHSPGSISELKERLPHRHPGLQDAMTRTGLVRLNLKQAWRNIPAVAQSPERVTFSWYVSGRSIRRISVQDAAKQLEAMGIDKPHVQIQMQILASLPLTEPLAQVQAQAPMMRANMTFPDQQGVERAKGERKPSRAMNVALPLFVASSDGTLPPFKTPSPTPPPARTQRARKDKRISDEPLLRSLRVHRYLVSS